MVKVSKSFLGNLSGKMGNYVFKTGKNGTYISSSPTPSNKPPSAEQLLQRNKLAVVIEFLKPLQSLLKEAYFPFQQNKSGFHAAKSYYLKEALIQDEEGYTVDYPKALVTYGDLRWADNLQLTADANNFSVLVQWSDNSEQANAYLHDQLILVCYALESKQMIYQTGLAQRSDRQAVWILGPHLVQTELHFWVGFYQPEAKRASPSCYAGVLSL